MNTLHGIRQIAFSAALGLSALAASAADRLSDVPGVAGTFADLGQITVQARRDTTVADLGSLTVSAPRLADLGSMTVTASRIADTRVADLGALTVTAQRTAVVTVATAQSSDRFWK